MLRELCREASDGTTRPPAGGGTLLLKGSEMKEKLLSLSWFSEALIRNNLFSLLLFDERPNGNILH